MLNVKSIIYRNSSSIYLIIPFGWGKPGETVEVKIVDENTLKVIKVSHRQEIENERKDSK